MKTSSRDHALRYCFAGMSNMCGAFSTNPVDVTKVRMQLDGELANQRGRLGQAYKERHYKGLIRGAITIAREEGILALYKGLTPSLLREATYSTIRIGAYEPIKVLFGATDRHHTPLLKKLGAGATSGAIGSTIAVPTDLIRVRLQAQGHLGATAQPTYRGFVHAFSDILTKEGFWGLYRGTSPTVQRAILLTGTQVPTYDHTKHTILNRGWMAEGPALHIVSAMTAGFMCAATTSPVDLIKTRVMNQRIKGIPKRERAYQNGLDCLLKTVRSEGWLGLYKGFMPNWLRIGPHTIISFFLFEYLRKKAGIHPI